MALRHALHSIIVFENVKEWGCKIVNLIWFLWENPEAKFKIWQREEKPFPKYLLNLLIIQENNS